MKLDHGRKVRACTFLDVGGKASAVAAGGARPRHRKALARSSVRMVGDAVPEGGQYHSQMFGFGMENVAHCCTVSLPPAVGQTATRHVTLPAATATATAAFEVEVRLTRCSPA